MFFCFKAQASDIAEKQILLMFRGMPWLYSRQASFRAPTLSSVGLLYPATHSRCVDVGGDFLARERLDANGERYALPKLRHFGLGQPLGQLRLSRQDDLHQFHPRRFEVGEQPD